MTAQRNQVNNCRKSKDFWKAVKSFRCVARKPVQVSDDDWLHFYASLLPQRSYDMNTFDNNKVEELEKPITSEELGEALYKLARNKAAGPDGIHAEFLKYLPNCNRNSLLALFNKFLESEQLPAEWGESETVTFHKKGCFKDPVNYRPIALLNSCQKLFMQIVQIRLQNWATENNIIPECQGGFRKNRGCEDQIFALSAAIQLNVQKKAGKVYAIFIDFERAFPSIPHSKLWAKLDRIGVSGKIIRIIRNLYEMSATVIRTEHGATPKIDMTLGLLQGCLLSPLLFSLYISDIENILKGAGIAGIKITHSFELHLLAFADDMVSMAPTPGHLQRKINILAEYFDKLDLKVNLNKTKIMIFRKVGRVGKVTFKYKGQPIEIVNEYTYLGVLFLSNGVFVKAAKHMKQKGKAAMSSAWNIFAAGKMSSFMSKSRMFDSLAASVPLYASHIWGLRYIDEIEILQSKFMHRSLGVSRLAPNYVLRLETGRHCIVLKIIKQCLHYWAKLLYMNESRYTRKCFDALCSNSNEDGINATYNWVSQVKTILKEFGCVSLLNERIPEAFLAQSLVCLLSILDQLRQKDIESVKKSERYHF